MAQGKTILVSDLGFGAVSENGMSTLENMNLDEVERLLIQKALARYNGNVSHAAKALGLSPQCVVSSPQAISAVAC